jgi:integrase
LPRGSIVSRKGKRGTSYFVVLRNRWHNVPDPQTKANAELYRAQLVTEDARGELVTAAPISFADFVDRWKAAKYAELSHNGRRGTDTYLRCYILPTFGQRRLSTITTEDVQRWKAQMLGSYAPSTTTTALNRLRSIFRDAVRWRYIQRDPCEGVQRPRQDKKEMRFLAPAEVGRLLAAAPSLYWRAWFMVAVVGGLRVAEMVAMRWQHLDFDAARYTVRESLQHRHGAKEFSRPKSTYSTAPVLLTPACVDLLRQHKAHQAAELMRQGLVPDLIFPRKDNTVMDPRMIHKQIWSKTLAKAGLEYLRIHDLRHTCAALWVAQSESAKFIQQQMRHSSIKTTLDTYGHLLPDAGAKAASALDAAILATH